MRTSISVAAAGGAITVALFECLAQNGIISNDEARRILVDAQTRLAFIEGDDAREAARIVGEMSKRLPKDGP